MVGGCRGRGEVEVPDKERIGDGLVRSGDAGCEVVEKMGMAGMGVLFMSGGLAVDAVNGLTEKASSPTTQEDKVTGGVQKTS
jgi:hypothetical protein